MEACSKSEVLNLNNEISWVSKSPLKSIMNVVRLFLFEAIDTSTLSTPTEVKEAIAVSIFCAWTTLSELYATSALFPSKIRVNVPLVTAIGVG